MTQPVYREIGGVSHKVCTGPAHDEPVYLPATEKFFYERKSGPRKGQIISRCRLCQNWSKLKVRGTEHGYVSRRDALPFYIEAVNRIGLMELSRRSGVSYNSLAAVISGKVGRVQKAKLKLVMLELISARRKGEFVSNALVTRWTQERLTKEERCSGCGTPQSNYTDECATCWGRKNKRERREAAA